MGTFTQKVCPVIMKVLLFAATLAIASAAFAPSCEECNQAAAGLLARLTSAESIAEQTGILISQVCPHAAACEAALSQWWGDMANCLYPAFIGAGDALSALGLCKVKSSSATGPATTAPPSLPGSPTLCSNLRPSNR